MSRFHSLARSLALVLIFTLITTTLNIQAAPLPQTASPDPWTPRVRDAESLPHLPGGVAPVAAPDIIDAATLYPWSRLAFQSFRDNNWEIYLGNDDGTGQIRLTNHSSVDAHPRLNRGATRIAFASARAGNYEIYTMNVDGTGLTRLTSNSTDDVLPYWSPDGSKIAFQAYRDGQAEVYVMNADGSGQTRLTNNSGYDGEPAWSPNGTKIAFASKRTAGSSDYRIWVMNADGSGQTQLTTQEYCENPVWSPDGTKIAYDAAGSDYWQNLWVVNADGSNPQVVFDESGSADAWARSWSPDGRYVAFTRIYYTINNNQLYWTSAYLDAWDSVTSGIVRLSSNGSDWRPDWQTTDSAAPSSYVNVLSAESPATFTVRWSGSDTGTSGLKSFDVQVKDGVNGTWATWQSETTATSTSYTGVGGHSYYFRSRARDNASNVEAWPANHDALTMVETAAPNSAVETLPEFSKDSVTVKWSGHDPGGSGIQVYDVQYQDVTSNGAWTNWQMGVVTTTASFAGITGHTYAFRSRALDRAQNQEDWPSGNGDAQTTFYAWAINGTAHTNTGSPLVGVNVTTEPGAQGVFATDLGGLYSAYIITPSNTYTVSWSKPGYGNLPATAFEDSAYTPIVYQGTLPAQGNIVTVGGLEVGQTYRIVVTGTFEYTIGGGAWADAQWAIAGHCTPGVFCYYSPNINFNGVLLAAQNDQNAVDPNHEYTFLWTADATQLQMHIMDSLYNDNSGSLAFEVSPENSASLYQGKLSAQGDVVTLGGFQVNQTYRIVMRGMFEFSIGGGSWADAQWTTWSCPSMVLCLHFGAVSYNGVQLNAQNGQDVVDPNHEYTFLWTADAPQLQMYILDSDYRDNSGHLTYEIFSDDVSSDPNVFLPPADDLILNGHFEQGAGAISDWIVSSIPTPTVSTAARHTGRQSALLRTTTPSTTNGSAIAQVVTIPVTITSPILSFLYHSGDSPLQNDLVAYWKLDETGGMRFDATARGNDLLDSTTVTSVTGKLGNAAQFLAANHQYLNLADNADLSTGDIDFTIAGWVYLDAPKTNGVAVSKADATTFSTIEYAWGYATPNDRFSFSVGNGSGGGATVLANTLGSPAANQWYFVAVWHDAVNNQLGISVNGISDVVSYSGGVADGSHEFRLGDDLDGRWWNGRLDEIGFWKRVLTAEELAALYNNGQGLTYPFNTSSSGGVFNIQVANGVTTTTVFTTVLDAADWRHQWLDLSVWKGQPITLTFMLQSTEDLPAQVYLDEITLGSGYPDTWVQLANPAVARPGGTVTYQLTYGNQAGVPASGVQLTATLPAQLTFVAASLPPTTTLTSLVWDLGDLPAQSGPHTILITAGVTSPIMGFHPVTNTGSISTATTELERANNTDQTSLVIKYDLFLPIIARE